MAGRYESAHASKKSSIYGQRDGCFALSFSIMAYFISTVSQDRKDLPHRIYGLKHIILSESTPLCIQGVNATVSYNTSAGVL